MTPTASVVPEVLGPSGDLAALLGPITLLGMTAILVALAVVIGGILIERRELANRRRLLRVPPSAHHREAA
jgi:hypothetical protein